MSALTNMFSVLNTQAPFAAVACDFASSAGFTKSADFTGNANGKQGILSFWARITSISGVTSILSNASGKLFLGTVGQAVHIYGEDAGGNQRLGIDTAYSLPLNVWNHFLMSWDGAAGVAKLYINDVYRSSGFELASNVDVVYAGSGWVLNESSFTGCLSEFYFAPNQFINITVEANRRKFISADLKPVDLGADGSLPTGTAPICYLKQNGSNKLVNAGSGGDFNSVVGTVNNCASSPSD